jgi:geranylgeranyl reductase family protein
MSAKSTDVLIVGAGPAGLTTAAMLAGRGFDVTVCEEHERVGQPVHCTGVLADSAFQEFGLSRRSVLNSLSRLWCVSPSGHRISYTTPETEAVVIDRAVFDCELADRALAAGVTILTNARVKDLRIDDDGVRACAGGRDMSARLVVLACGARYGFQKKFGLGLPAMYLHSAQCEIPAVEGGDVELHFGNGVAPAGFAWSVPVHRPSGPHVRVGVMASRSAPWWHGQMLSRLANRVGDVRELKPPRQKILPLGPIRRTVANRMLVVGDAAGLVKPTTGGGIYYALTSGSIAADVAAHALARNRFDAPALSTYETNWRQRIASELKSQAFLRQVAEAMSDTEIDDLFELTKVNGLMPLLRSHAKFNQHRPLIVELFKYRPARRILFRSFRREPGFTTQTIR